ncbi:potassium channel protein [Paenibacillus shirakamiensis]
MRIMHLRKTTVGGFVLLFVIAAATVAYALEPSTFNTWFNAFYWVLTTMATVGYGDYYAKTVPGKAFTIFLYIFGIGLLSLVIANVIDSVGTIQRKRGSGTLDFKGSQHVILINWSKKVQYAIDEVLSYTPNAHIVVVDESTRHPLEHIAQVHFVSGDPSDDEVLRRAGIHRAKAAIVFADVRITEASLVDGKSLLIISSIERIAPSVHTTVEIVQEKNVQNFRHNQVNDFVLSHDAISRLAVRSALQEGNSDILSQLLSRQYGDDIYQIPVQPSWTTYGDAFKDLLKQGATLLADRNDLSINRKLNQQIPSGAKLYIVSDADTYQQILEK